MTRACAGGFSGDVGFVSACGIGAPCVPHNVAEDRRISERIPFLIVGCIRFSLAGPGRVAVEECPLLIGWTDSAMRAFKRRTWSRKLHVSKGIRNYEHNSGIAVTNHCGSCKSKAPPPAGT